MSRHTPLQELRNAKSNQKTLNHLSALATKLIVRCKIFDAFSKNSHSVCNKILMIGQIGHGWVPKCRSLLLFALLTTMRIFNPAIFCLLHCSRGFSIFSLFPVCSAFFLISVNHFLCRIAKDVYDMNPTQEDTSLLWIFDSTSKSTEENIRSTSTTT